MSHTQRRNWFGNTIRDGQHAKRCPEKHCAYCIHGDAKRTARRKTRHASEKVEP